MKHAKHIRIAAIITGVIVVLVIVFLVLLRINFLIGDEIKISLNPEYAYVEMNSPSNLSFNTNIQIYNKVVCNAVCTYTLKDLSHNTTIDSSELNSKSYTSKSYSKEILLSDNGFGQNVYVFDISCRNIQATLCPTANQTVDRKSILAVRYSPSKDQLESLNALQTEYNDTATLIQQSEDNMRYASSILDSINLSVNNSGALIQKFNGLLSELALIEYDFNSTLSIWRLDDYSAAKRYYDSKLLSFRITNTYNSTESYIEDINTTVLRYNNFISILDKDISGLTALNSVLSRGLCSDKYEAISNISVEVSNASRDLNLDSVGNDDSVMLSARLDKADADIQSMYSSILYPNTLNNSYANFYPSLYTYYSINCMQNGATCNLSSRDDTLFFPTDINAFQRSINENCQFASFMSGTMSEGNLSMDSKESLTAIYLLLGDYSERLDVYFSGSDQTSTRRLIHDKIDSYRYEISQQLFSEYAVNTSNLPANYTYSNINYSAVTLGENLVWRDFASFNDMCANYSNYTSIAIPLADKSYISLPLGDTSAYNSTHGTSNVVPAEPVPENKCCIYNYCNCCSGNNCGTYPLILLHGHSFNENTDAYNSIEIFNDYEIGFIDTGKYYPFGTLVNYNSTIDLTGTSSGMLVKPTYYVESYNDLLGFTVSESKTDSIDTYTLRLKEIIDSTKKITGRDKVDIVAHSMGGLVVRRYIQVFGGDSIDKFIMIGTPNQGISGNAYSLCGIFGAKNECDDMKQGSLFMNKLNQEGNNGLVPKTYLVAGKGCSTDGQDGDGIVSLNNTLINIPSKNILIINGTCTNTEFLHNDMLDRNKYPAVYNFVLSNIQ